MCVCMSVSQCLQIDIPMLKIKRLFSIFVHERGCHMVCIRWSTCARCLITLSIMQIINDFRVPQELQCFVL